MTFFDLDTGLPYPTTDGYFQSQTEVIQISPDVTELILSRETSEIDQHRRWAPDVIDQTSFDRVFNATGALENWGTPVFMATTRGIGADNPSDPLELTELQKARSIMIKLEGASTFRVRFAIDRCCTTGRNLLLAGYSNVVRGLCTPPPAPPPLPPSPPSRVPAMC